MLPPESNPPMRVCMLVRNACTHDQRVMREAAALAAAGHQVTVLAHLAEGPPAGEDRDGYTIRRLPLCHLPAEWRRRLHVWLGGRHRWLRQWTGDRPANLRRLLRRRLGWAGVPVWSVLLAPILLVAGLPLLLLRGLVGRVLAITGSRRTMQWLERLRPVQWIHEASYVHRFLDAAVEVRAEVYHAHDLNTLQLAYLAARRTGAAVVYDSHEFHAGIEAPKWTRFDRWYWARQERRLIHFADRVITVSDSIADALARRHHIRRPVVVTNANRPLNARLQAAAGLDVRAEYGLRADQRLVVYIGGIQTNRGLEVLIDAMGLLDDRHHLLLIGPTFLDAYQAELAERARRLGVADRVRFHAAVPPSQVVPALAQADCSVLLTQNTCENHYMSLPNKLFDSILAAAPLVASNLIEIRRVVTSGPFGVVCRESDPAAVAEAIRDVAADPDRYRPGPEALAALEQRYGWTACRRRLLDIYTRIAVQRARRGRKE